MAKKAKVGRPSVSADQRRQAALGFRPTPEIRQKLEERAATNLRSLSAEIESRLEQSFTTEGVLGVLGADAKTAAFLTDFLHVKSLIETHTGKSAWTDYEAHLALSSAVQQLLLERAPKPSADMKKRTASWEKEKKRKKGAYGGPRGIVGLDLAGDWSGTSPIEQAEIVGKAAARTVSVNRHTSFARALATILATPDDIDVGDDD